MTTPVHEPSSDVRPAYYKTELSDGTPIEVADAMEAFFRNDVHLATIFNYLARAGKKPGSKKSLDLRKAQRWLDRAIALAEMDEGGADRCLTWAEENNRGPAVGPTTDLTPAGPTEAGRLGP